MSTFRCNGLQYTTTGYCGLNGGYKVELSPFWQCLTKWNLSQSCCIGLQQIAQVYIILYNIFQGICCAFSIATVERVDRKWRGEIGGDMQQRSSAGSELQTLWLCNQQSTEVHQVLQFYIQFLLIKKQTKYSIFVCAFLIEPN